MADPEPILRYEDAAEYRTDIRGWVCKKCHRYHGNQHPNETFKLLSEHFARNCCANDRPCACGGRITRKGYCQCDACIEKSQEAKWQKALAEAVPWDGEYPVCVYDGDTFFFDEDDLRDYLEEHDLAPETVRLIACTPHQPRTFEMGEYLCDDLLEDDDTDFAEIDKIVNDWIAAHLPKSCDPAGSVLTAASVREVLGWEDVAATTEMDTQEGE